MRLPSFYANYNTTKIPDEPVKRDSDSEDDDSAVVYVPTTNTPKSQPSSKSRYIHEAAMPLLATDTKKKYSSQDTNEVAFASLKQQQPKSKKRRSNTDACTGNDDNPCTDDVLYQGPTTGSFRQTNIKHLKSSADFTCNDVEKGEETINKSTKVSSCYSKVKPFFKKVSDFLNSEADVPTSIVLTILVVCILIMDVYIIYAYHVYTHDSDLIMIGLRKGSGSTNPPIKYPLLLLDANDTIPLTFNDLAAKGPIGILQKLPEKPSLMLNPADLFSWSNPAQHWDKPQIKSMESIFI